MHVTSPESCWRLSFSSISCSKKNRIPTEWSTVWEHCSSLVVSRDSEKVSVQTGEGILFMQHPLYQLDTLEFETHHTTQIPRNRIFGTGIM